MKTKLVFTAILASFLFFIGCSGNDDIVQESGLDPQGLSVSESSIESESSTVSKISSSKFQTFPQAQQEVIETFGAIAQSIIDGDMDKLISFHAYGPKFTEFKNGEPRNGGEENEAHERLLFGEQVTAVEKFAADDLQVAVYYGKVANVTFHSDFVLWFGETRVEVKNQITLLFVKTKGEWKMVHEHHSPLTPPNE